MLTLVRNHTYKAEIYIGLKDLDTKQNIPWQNVMDEVIQPYVNRIGLCVSVETVNYFYTDGNEFGMKVTLINYPRFPDVPEKIKGKALDLASDLLIFCKQKRCSVVCPDETIMLSNE